MDGVLITVDAPELPMVVVNAPVLLIEVIPMMDVVPNRSIAVKSIAYP